MSVPQPKLSDVVDVRTRGRPGPRAPSSHAGEDRDAGVRRLTLTKGREIPTHHARGEITVHYLEGRIAGDRTPYTPPGLGRTPGHLIAARKLHSPSYYGSSSRSPVAKNPV